nr:hypothetical protein [Tanacetum cinerariifolium]
MLATYVADKPVVFKAPKTSSKAKSVSQGTKLGAQTRHKKPLTSSKQPSVSSKEITKGGSSKATTEDQQATGGPTSLGATSEARANPQLSSETILTQPIRGKGASSVISQFKKETSSIIKLEDLAKLMSHVQPSFKDLDSPKDDPVIVMNDSDKDEDDEIHATKNVETKDTLVPKSSSPRYSQIQELTNQVLILQSQKYKLELEKNKVEVAFLKAQPSFPNVEQLKELLVKSLKTELTNILSTYEFSNSLLTKLKDLPSKFNDLTEEVKRLKNKVHNWEIELPRELKEIPPKLEDFTKTVTILTSQVAELKTLQWELPAKFLFVPLQVEMVQAKLKTLDALPCLLNKVINSLNQFAQAITSKKTRGDSVPSGKKALSLEEAMKESTESDSDNNETHLSISMVESSRIKKVKKFDFVTEDGKHIYLTEEQINQQKKIEEEAKAKATKRESK